MGHSRLCEFDGRLMIGTKEARVGIKNLKEARNWFSDSCKSVNGFSVDTVILWPQTARAKRFAQGYDYVKVTRESVTRHNVTA